MNPHPVTGVGAACALWALLASRVAIASTSPVEEAADVAVGRTLTAVRTEDRGSRDLLDVLAGSEGLALGGAAAPVLDGVELRRWLLRWDGIPLLRAQDPADDLRSLRLPLCLGSTLRLGRGPQAGAPDALAGVVDVGSPDPLAPFGGRVCSELRAGDRLAGRSSAQLATRSRSWRTLLAGFVDGDHASASAGGVLGRGDIALGQRGAAGLQLLHTTWLDDGHAIDRQLFALHSTMQLAPGHLLRFRWTRQTLIESRREDRPQRLRTGETGFDVGYQGELVERHGLRAHVVGRVADRTVDWSDRPSAVIQRAVFGTWLQDAWRIRPNLGVIGVVGVDLDDGVGALPAGHGELRYEPTPALVLRGRIGSATRAPGLDERSERGRRSFLWPDLAPSAVRPERAQGLELTVGLEPSSTLGMHGGLFSLELSDLLVPVRGARAQELAGVRNGGRETLQGLFVDAEAARLPGGVALWLGYQWLWEARDAWRARDLPERRTHQLRLHASWDLVSLGSHLFASTDLGLPAAPAQPGLSTTLAQLGLRQRLLGHLELVLVAAQQGPVQGLDAGPIRRELRAGLALD